MLSFAQELGLEAELKIKQTLDEVEEKLMMGTPSFSIFRHAAEDRRLALNPDWENRWEDGHYAVLVAYDDRNLYFMDIHPCSLSAFVPRREFLARWHDYEVRDGARVENFQLALYIKGKTLTQFSRFNPTHRIDGNSDGCRQTFPQK